MPRARLPRLTWGLIFLAGLASLDMPGRAAAPAAPSYQDVEQTITTIRNAWSKPGAPVDPNAPGWNGFFDALLQDLQAYTRAEDENARLIALNRIFQMSQALGAVQWKPAGPLREDLRNWLRPRVRLAWAKKQIRDTLRGLPQTTDSAALSNRQRWSDFVQNDLGQALHEYETALTVARKQTALSHIYQALGSLDQRNAETPWQPSLVLQQAVDSLFNRPNLDITADLGTVQPLFNNNLVVSGPVERKGYISQVTAGPMTGFGMLPSDDGIAFYNSQLLTSVTPIWDFQNQIASDPQGQRAAKLYTFSATTYDWAELTVVAVLRTSGLQLAPSYKHTIDAAICSVPNDSGGLGRAIASLIGLNQNKITQKVKDGAMPQFQQKIPTEAMEEGLERTSAEAAKRNAEVFSKYLPGNNTLAINEILISQLDLRSRPTAAYISGLLQWRDSAVSHGADAPQPARLDQPDSGLTIDLHLGSIMTGVADGALKKPQVQAVQNLMIVTKKAEPGTPPQDATTITRNVDFPTYASAVAEARAAKDPKVTAIRVKRPDRPPVFAADARGNLVATVRDLQIEVPAPEGNPNGQGGGLMGVPAKILRVVVPEAELVVSYDVVPATADKPTRLTGKIVEFTPAVGSQVFAINDDEAKAQALTRFTSGIVLAAVGARLRSFPIDLPLDQVDAKGVQIRSVSKLDPSGWMRVNLVRNGNAQLPAAAEANSPSVATSTSLISQ
jgi:hypothetical protein